MEAEIEQAFTDFERTESLEDLHKVVEKASQAVDSYGQGADSRLLNKLGYSLQLLFDMEPQPGQLDRAVWALQQAVKRTTADDPQMPKYLYNLGLALWARWKEQHNYKDLKEATRSLRGAAYNISVPCPKRADYLKDLSDILRVRYLQSRLGCDLQEVVNGFVLEDVIEGCSLKEVIEDCDLEEAIKGCHREELIEGCDLEEATNGYHQEAIVGCDLEEAIDHSRQALDSQSISEEDFADLANDLSLLLQKRAYMSPHRLDDLNEAIAWSEKVSELEHLKTLEDWPYYLNTMSTALLSRYWISHISGDVDRAIKWAANALRGLPKGHPTISNNLADALLAKWEAEGRLDDLDETIDRYHECVEKTDCYDPIIVRRRDGLGCALLIRSEIEGSVGDIKRSIHQLTLAIRVLSQKQGQSYLPRLLNHLSKAYQVAVKIDSTLPKKVVDDALKAAEHAVRLAPEGFPSLCSYLYTLTSALLLDYNRNGNRKALTAALTRAREAKDLVLTSSFTLTLTLAGALEHLSIVLQYEFQETGDLKILDEAIEVAKETLVPPEGSREYADQCNSLGNALVSRFEWKGFSKTHLSDLNEAVKYLARAIEIRKNLHGVVPSGYYGNLGLALHIRYDRTGSREDLDKAIDLLEIALNLDTSISGPLPQRNLNLSRALVARSLLGGRQAKSDLDRAIELAQAAVDTSSPENPNSWRHHNNLGVVLRTRHEGPHGTPEDLTTAVEHFKKAVNNTLETDLARVGCLNNLGTTLTKIFETTGGSEEILREAIRCFEQCVEATKDNPQFSGGFSKNLSDALGILYQESLNTDELDRAVAYGEAAFNNASAPPSIRISSAYRAGAWRVIGNPTKEEQLQAARLWAGAVDLLPLLSPKDMHRIDQQFQLQKFDAYTLVSNAAALTLKTEHPPLHAIQILETGRGVILGHILDCRTDTSNLQETYPELAERFDTLRNFISGSEDYLKNRLSEESAGSKEGMPSALRLALHRAQLNDATSEFDQTVKEIRSKRGFERFLSPLSLEELRNLSTDGYLAIVNVSHIRCDAITVSQGKTCVVPLPGLEWATLEDKENLFRSAIKRRKKTPDTARKTLLGVLKWLWDVCAKPILDSLGLCVPCHGRENPRLWWVLGGVLGRLPLHACGDYGQTQASHDEACTVPAIVVSSYVPTLRALGYARQHAHRQLREPKHEQRALIVAVPQSDGAADVFGTQAEAEKLKTVLQNSKLLVNPTYAEVREELQHSSIAHFACHSISNDADPGRSYLSLRDWEDHPLNVSALMNMNLTSCQLAYLSACKTADSAVEALVDESIHLVSGFMLAGSPSVVGTLWETPDDDNAKEVAAQFYSRLPEKDGILCTEHSAAALASAISFVREQCPGGDDPLTWAAFIHTGA